MTVLAGLLDHLDLSDEELADALRGGPAPFFASPPPLFVPIPQKIITFAV